MPKNPKLSLLLAVSLSLAACATSRQSKPLAYPGDGRSTVDSLQAAIGKRGYKPVCSARAFCKFAYNDQIWIHFKAKPKQVVLAVDVAEGKDMPAEKLRALVDEATAVGEAIWKEASADAIERERQAAAKEKAEKEARAAKEREEEEAARKAEAQKPAKTGGQSGSSGGGIGGVLDAAGSVLGRVSTSNTGGSQSGPVRCCINYAYYDCPTPASVNKCAGETAACLSGCMQSNDMDCGDRCMREHPPDPSGCTRRSDRDGECPR